MSGQLASQKTSFFISLPNGSLTSSYGQMTVCRCTDCYRAAACELGFCADDHAAYVRSRQGYAWLAKAAQIVHANAFAVVPTAHRQMLAEYLVAVCSEGLAPVPADIPRLAGLLAAALIARGPVGPSLLDSHGTRRRRLSRDTCTVVGGTLR